MSSDQLSLKALVRAARPSAKLYESLYKQIYSNPELYHLEAETASLISRHLEALTPEFEISKGIGGHGLILLLRNGNGKTLVLRADMDALSVADRTDLHYASSKKQIGEDGKEKAIMHGKLLT